MEKLVMQAMKKGTVKKTTQEWCGSGCMLGSPSDAHPVSSDETEQGEGLREDEEEWGMGDPSEDSRVRVEWGKPGD
ncbi:hypothetical protein JZ751_001467 [Albula glossodonta]|uniref:Uncharacterized protein n=1 Tax=Albula glossodonta TaxID=121402 RepID=A0A8T2PTT8_9TELE|nr:hypothetical protein JZ751_001467 [Albula glossodonta]